MFLEDDFFMVLQNSCTVENKTFTITSSINGLIYRVEVKESEALIDAIEVSCQDLRFDPNSETLFEKTYTDAHNEMQAKYCLKEKSEEEEHSYVVYKAKKTLPKRRNFLLLNNQLNSKIILSLVLISMLVLFLFLGKIFLCSQFVQDNFLSTKQEKIEYLEKIEPLCHRLEKECKNISAESIENKQAFTIADCQSWCENGIIARDECEDILPALKKRTQPIAHKIPKPKAIVIQGHNRYNILPKTIKLLPLNTFTLTFTNHHDTPLYVELLHISLNENDNKEIVQLRDFIFYFDIPTQENKSFKFFLEPSYYRQFMQGKYTGEMTFNLKYENEDMLTLKRDFFFEVN